MPPALKRSGSSGGSWSSEGQSPVGTPRDLAAGGYTNPPWFSESVWVPPGSSDPYVSLTPSTPSSPTAPPKPEQLPEHEQPQPQPQGVPVEIMRVGGPNVLRALSGVGGWWAAVMVLSRYTNESTMAAFSLSNSFCNLCGNFLIWGCAGGLPTLASQAYGAGNYRMVGLYTCRVTVLMLLCVCLPTSICYLFAAPLLKAFGQQAAVADEASTFIFIALPGLFLNACTTSLMTMMSCMKKTAPVAIVSAIVDVVIVLSLLLFVATLGWNLEGTAISINLIPNLLRFVGSCLLVLRDPECVRCWPGISSEIFEGWGEYLKLGLPSLLMVVAEAFSWEIVTLLAGLCHTADGTDRYTPEQILAAQAILQSIIFLAYCLPSGIKDGVGAVVGIAVGNKDESRASRAAWVGLLLAFASSGVVTILLILFRAQAVQMFGAPRELEQLVADFVPWISLFILVDSVQISLSGTITGAGKQMVSMPVLVVSYFAIGMPLGGALTFAWPKLGLLGLWLGITVGASLHCIAYLLVCFARCPGSIQWDVVISEATERLEQSEPNEEDCDNPVHSQLDDKDNL